MRVVVISGDALARAGLAALIAARDVEVVGQGGPADAAELADAEPGRRVALRALRLTEPVTLEAAPRA